MEKIDRSQRKSYTPLVLKPDQLESILEILAEGDCEVNIESADFRYASMDELAEHQKRDVLTKLTLTSTGPFVSLELSEFEAVLYASSSKAKSSAKFHRIDAILSKSQRWPSLAFNYFFFTSLPFLAVAANYLIAPESPLVVVPLLLVPLIWLMIASSFSFFGRSKIFLKQPERQESFVKRHAETIIVGVVILIVGSVSSSLITAKILSNSTGEIVKEDANQTGF